MSFASAALILGVLLITMALSSSVLRRLPLSAAILYLALGVVLGGHVTGLLRVDFVQHSGLLERVTEIAVLLSLFTSGLKLRTHLDDWRWSLPVRLASISMLITVAGVTLLGTFWLGLPLGASVLLGAVLAPTDPVLASDVQVSRVGDRERLRFALTGEAGLNDGTAFPFVMLGLGLLALHPLGTGGWRWFAVDVVWAVAAGLGVGALLGSGLGRVVVHLRSRYRQAVGLNEFITLGLIGLSYGAALHLKAYGFLAVFAAGHALRRVEHASARPSEDAEPAAGNAVADAADQETAPDRAPAYMTHAVLSFNEQLERIAEVILVVLIGALLTPRGLSLTTAGFVVAMLVIVRPVAVVLGLLGSRTNSRQRALTAWFGIRGIGSLYYLSFAVEHGVPRHLAEELVSITLLTVATSIVVHGVSVTPLMNLYETRTRGRDSATA